MAESACPDCGGKIGIKATRCRCGWKMLGTPQKNDAPPQQHIQCCFDECQNSANVRMWTKTGWVNVCARVNANQVGVFHYERVEMAPRVSHTQHLDELRAKLRSRVA